MFIVLVGDFFGGGIKLFFLFIKKVLSLWRFLLK